MRGKWKEKARKAHIEENGRKQNKQWEVGGHQMKEWIKGKK